MTLIQRIHPSSIPQVLQASGAVKQNPLVVLMKPTEESLLIPDVSRVSTRIAEVLLHMQTNSRKWELRVKRNHTGAVNYSCVARTSPYRPQTDEPVHALHYFAVNRDGCANSLRLPLSGLGELQFRGKGEEHTIQINPQFLLPGVDCVAVEWKTLCDALGLENLNPKTARALRDDLDLRVLNALLQETQTPHMRFSHNTGWVS